MKVVIFRPVKFDLVAKTRTIAHRSVARLVEIYLEHGHQGEGDGGELLEVLFAGDFHVRVTRVLFRAGRAGRADIRGGQHTLGVCQN